MNTKFLLSLYLLVHLSSSVAQHHPDKTIRISTVPFQFIFLDFPIYLEKTFDRNTIGVMISLRPSTKQSGEVHGGMGILGDYKIQNFWNPFYNAATMGLLGKHYTNKTRTTFVECNLFYRYWWFANKNICNDNVEGYRFNGLRTEHQHIMGLKMQIGGTIRSKKGGNHFIDIYCGLGVRYRYFHFETYNGTVYDNYL